MSKMAADVVIAQAPETQIRIDNRQGTEGFLYRLEAYAKVFDSIATCR